MKKQDEEKQLKEERKNLEFPVKLQFISSLYPRKEIMVDAVLITGKEKFFYLILSAKDSILNLFKESCVVYAYYENLATFKFINKIENCGKCVSLKFELVYNKLSKRG